MPNQKSSRPLTAAVLAIGLAAACNTTKHSIPELAGPAETAISVQLDARPDALVADGHSTAAIQITLRNSSGGPIAGQAVTFALTDATGNFADIGKLSQSTAVTNGSGMAQVIYTTPPRTDATANRSIQVAARPVTGDAKGQFYRTVTIELRSAEPRLFPQLPGNSAPNCNFASEPSTGLIPFGTDFLAQSTSSDDDGFIVRYEWDFGDGETEDKPDIVHRYAFPGQYTVVHVVTDNGGAQSGCELDVVVF